MHVIDCPLCQRRYLAGASSQLWFANTDHGPRSLVRCPEGHDLIEDHRTATTFPATNPDPNSRDGLRLA